MAPCQERGLAGRKGAAQDIKRAAGHCASSGQTYLRAACSNVIGSGGSNNIASHSLEAVSHISHLTQGVEPFDGRLDETRSWYEKSRVWRSFPGHGGRRKAVGLGGRRWYEPDGRKLKLTGDEVFEPAPSRQFGWTVRSARLHVIRRINQALAEELSPAPSWPWLQSKVSGFSDAVHPGDELFQDAPSG